MAVALARRFGLRLEADAGASALRRGDRAVRLRGGLTTDSVSTRHRALSACLGARLGLDRLQADRSEHSTKSIVELDVVQRLLPRAAVALAEHVAGVELLVTPWLTGAPFDVTYLRETGKLLVPIRTDELQQEHAARFFENARRALFYQAYRLRPADERPLAGGKLRIYSTTGGLASSVATLLPDFDYDAARERGVAIVPGYDVLGVWRPDGTDPVPSQLRRALREMLVDAALPFSRRTYPLRADGIVVGEAAGASAELDAADLVRNLIGVTDG